MKKIVLIFFLWVCVLPCSRAQNYTPLADTNFTWNIEEGDIWSWSTYRCKLAADTMINGKVYRPVLSEDYFNAPGILNKVAFIREDTLRKVYVIRHPDYQSLGETMLYDFGLDVGDTIVNRHYYPAFDDNIWTVMQIDTVSLLSGGKRLRWLLMNAQSEEDYWIEGTGSLKGLLYAGTPGIVCPFTKLLCFYQSGNLEFQNDTACYAVSAVKANTPQQAPLVYPNVTKDKIFISFAELQSIGNFLIFNSAGHCIEQAALNSGQIDAGRLAPGLYILQLVMKSGLKYHYRFLKI
jgi:hypothetical protein